MRCQMSFLDTHPHISFQHSTAAHGPLFYQCWIFASIRERTRRAVSGVVIDKGLIQLKIERYSLGHRRKRLLSNLFGRTLCLKSELRHAKPSATG